MAESYAALAMSAKGQLNAIAVDCDKYSDVCGNYGITGFPTLRLYNNSEMIPFSGLRTKAGMLRWLQEKGAYTALRSIRVQELDTELHRSRAGFLYLGSPTAPAEEKHWVDLAAIEYDHGALLYSTDPELLRRFPAPSRTTGYNSVGSRILAFKEYQTQPSSALELNTLPADDGDAARDKIVHWLQLHGHELLSEVDSKKLKATLDNDERQPIVLAVLGADTNDASVLSAQIDSVRKLAAAWAKQASSHVEDTPRFVWLDHERYPTLLQEKFRVDVQQVPQLFYFRPADHTMMPYSGATLPEESTALAWLSAIQAGSVSGVSYGSVFDRTFASMRTSGTTAQSFLSAHPLLSLIIVVGVLLLIPRVRQAIRPVAQGYRKLV